VDWLKFEAVFADCRGRLPEWTQALYPRLSRIVRDAQDPVDSGPSHQP
jgi:hypothetical protein